MQPRTTRREVPDGVISGLYLVLQPSGVKSWAVRYRLNRKPCKLTLGRFPAVDLSAARDLAKAALQDVDKDIDPKVNPKRSAAPNSVEADALPSDLGGESKVDAVWKAYCALRLVGLKRSASTIRQYKSIFNRHALPKWRDRPIAGITKRDVLAVIDKAAGNGRSARNSCIAVLSSFFNWCAKDRDLIVSSPADGIAKSKEASRERVLTDDEIKLLWKGCDGLGFPFGPMFKMLLLTGARRTEVAGMNYSELNLKSRLWTIPSERSKTRKPHPVYLSDAALLILKSLPRIAGSKFVFSTSGKSASSGYSKAKTKLDKLSGLSDYVLHDLRRTFATGLAKLGISATVTEKCLNHTGGTLKGVAAIYNRHNYEREMADAWAEWGDHVAGLVRGDVAEEA
jgi:integrase